MAPEGDKTVHTSTFLKSLVAIGMAAGIGLTLAAPAGAARPQTAPSASAGSRAATCSGTFHSPGVLAGTYQHGVVVSGYCVVDGGAAVVLGNLTVAPNSALNATFALNDVSGSGTSSLGVFGDIDVLGGAALVMGCEPNFNPCSDDPNAATGGTLSGHDAVFGSVNASGATGVILHASSIVGSVDEVGGGGGVNCAPPKGIFKKMGSPAFSDYEDNTIGGDLSIVGLQSCWLGALRNQVGGSIMDQDGTFADPDASEVNSNVVQGDMVCLGNSPVVQFGDSMGSPNQVAGNAKGECSFRAEQPDPAPTGPLTHISVKV
jgi:hypothetical protein